MFNLKPTPLKSNMDASSHICYSIYIYYVWGIMDIGVNFPGCDVFQVDIVGRSWLFFPVCVSPLPAMLLVVR